MTTITDILGREHKTVLRRLDRFEQDLAAGDAEGVRDMLRFFDERMILHRRKEEEVLFPVLGGHIGTQGGPIAVMLMEHEDEKGKIEELRAALDQGEIARVTQTGTYIVNLLRNHIMKEDNILFPMAEQAIPEEEKADMKTKMDAIGDCCED